MGDGGESIRAQVASSREFPAAADLSPREAAALSGCSYWTVLEEIKRGNLRAYRRPGGRLAIRREDFCGWAYAVPVVPRQPDQSVDTAPRRRRRPTGSASVLRELEQSRG